MRIVDTLEKLPYALTIGNFDGLHRGHQHLLSILKNSGLPTAVLTFSNHPSDVLKNRAHSPLLCTQEHKIRLFGHAGIDLLIVLPFTVEFAQQSYTHFLKSLKEHLCFSQLILGKGAALGNRQEGTEEKVSALGKTLGFETHYIDKHLEISSGAIRKAILQGDLETARLLLGRPFSLYAKPAPEIDGSGLCLPPNGTYLVTIGEQAGTATIEGSKISLKTSEALSPQPVEIFFKD